MRKQLFFLVMALVCVQLVSAQTKQLFKPFKVDIGLGITGGGSGSQGATIHIEPGYNFLGYFKAGVQFKGSGFSMKSINSNLFTFDVYYTKAAKPNSLHAFIGGGIGSYFVNKGGMSGGCSGGPSTVTTVRDTKSFGGMARAGFEAGHFRLTAEYNFVPVTYVTDVGISGKNLGVMEYKNGFFGITLGVAIGGGRK